MAKYRITFNPIGETEYEIEASNEEEAVKIGRELYIQEYNLPPDSVIEEIE